MGHDNFCHVAPAHGTICVLEAHLTVATGVVVDRQGDVPDLHLLRWLRVLAVDHCHWHRHRGHRRRRRAWRPVLAPNRSTGEVSRSPE
jgi:hypothetical protein